MILDELSKDIVSDDFDEIVDFFTSGCVLLAKGVEDNAAVDIDIF